MKSILSALFLNIIFFNSVNAEGIWVQGTLDCGRWIEARNLNRSEIFEGFIQGYANGLALGQGFDFWVIKGKITPDQVFFWMDKYCADNPLSNAMTGVHRLFDERR